MSESESHSFSQFPSRIKVKLGNIEIDFEGTEEYIRSDLPKLLELIYTYSSELEDDSDGEMGIEEVEELPDNPDPTSQKLQNQ